jgi:hypothetical protein
MEMTSLWHDVHNGIPSLRNDIERTDDPELIRSVLRFLRGGTVVVHGSTPQLDWLAHDHGEVVPTGFRTDGVWIWPDELQYYLLQHGILPEPRLLQHMEQRGWGAGSPSPNTLLLAHRHFE